MQRKSVLSKLSLLLIFLLVSTQAFAQSSPQYTWRLNQLFLNPTGSVRVPELYAKATVAASQTDSSIIAAVAGKKIRVLSIVAITGGTATTSTFNSKGSGAGVAISAPFSFGANGGFVLPFNPAGWFETVSAEALTVTTGAGSTTGYQVTYVAY